MSRFLLLLADMVQRYDTGTRVEWNWGAGTGTGLVEESFTSRVERSFDGTDVVRNADHDNPAYLIEQEDGTRVLKSHSELSNKT